MTSPKDELQADQPTRPAPRGAEALLPTPHLGSEESTGGG